MKSGSIDHFLMALIWTLIYFFLILFFQNVVFVAKIRAYFLHFEKNVLSALDWNLLIDQKNENFGIFLTAIFKCKKDFIQILKNG